MSSLVPIPWQPYYYLTPHTLDLLQKASTRAGRQLRLYTGDSRGLLSAWRSYVQQKELYEAYLHGGTPASNPDTGQRSHMRGAAFDLVDQDTATQNACRAVGLIRDSDEPWHWNDPSWASMPIIYTNTSVAGGGISALTTKGTLMLRIKHVNGTNAAWFVWNGQDTIWLKSKYKGDFDGLPGIEFHGTNAEFTAWRELNRINGGGAVVLDQAAIDALAAAISPKLAIPTVQQIVVGITAWFKRP